MTGAPNAEARQAGVMDATRALERLGGTRPRSSCSASPPAVGSAAPYARDGSSSARAAGTPSPLRPTPARRRPPSLPWCACGALRRTTGGELKTQPRVPEVIVRRGRKLSVGQRTGVAVHWANLAHDQVEHGVTTPLRTIVETARGSRQGPSPRLCPLQPARPPRMARAALHLGAGHARPGVRPLGPDRTHPERRTTTSHRAGVHPRVSTDTRPSCGRPTRRPSGQLEDHRAQRGIGDIYTMTVDEYLKAVAMGKIKISPLPKPVYFVCHNSHYFICRSV